MPHFVIEYARELEEITEVLAVMEAVRDAAIESDVMHAEDIKVRAVPIDHYLMAGDKGLFVHTSVYLLDGRTKHQKHRLSSLVREAKAKLLPSVKSISIDVRDMDKDAYLKRLLQDD